MSMDDGYADHRWPGVGRRDVLRAGAAMGATAALGLGAMASARGGAKEEGRLLGVFDSGHVPFVLGAILADYFGVAFVSPNRTSDYMEVTAVGPGSERIGEGGGGCIDNVDLHGVMVEAMGLGGAMPPGMEEHMPMPRAIKPD